MPHTHSTTTQPASSQFKQNVNSINDRLPPIPVVVVHSWFAAPDRNKVCMKHFHSLPTPEFGQCSASVVGHSCRKIMKYSCKFCPIYFRSTISWHMKLTNVANENFWWNVCKFWNCPARRNYMTYCICMYLCRLPLHRHPVCLPSPQILHNT